MTGHGFAVKGFFKTIRNQYLVNNMMKYVVLEPGDRDHILSGVFNQFLSANPRASRINKKSANNPALID